MPHSAGGTTPDPLALDDLAGLLGYDAGRMGGPPMSGFLQRVLDRLESGHHALTRSEGVALAECWWMSRIDDPAAGGRPAQSARDIASAKAILVYDHLASATPATSGGADAQVSRLASTLEAIAPGASIMLAVPSGDGPMIEAVRMAGGDRLGIVSSNGAVRSNRRPGASPAEGHQEVPVADQDLDRVATALGEVFR
jgi:hypothetical protein